MLHSTMPLRGHMSNSKLPLGTITARVEKARDYSLFQPSEAQRRSKSNFWSFFAGEGTSLPETVSLALALKYSGDRGISKWWDLEGFQDWFSNRDEFRQRVDFLADLALDQAYDLMRDPKANPSARVAVMKLIMELGQKIQSKTPKEQYLDSKIAEMDTKQLQEFIQSRTRVTPPLDESETDDSTVDNH